MAYWTNLNSKDLEQSFICHHCGEYIMGYELSRQYTPMTMDSPDEEYFYCPYCGEEMSEEDIVPKCKLCGEDCYGEKKVIKGGNNRPQKTVTKYFISDRKGLCENCYKTVKDEIKSFIAEESKVWFGEGKDPADMEEILFDVCEEENHKFYSK